SSTFTCGSAPPRRWRRSPVGCYQAELRGSPPGVTTSGRRLRPKRASEASANESGRGGLSGQTPTGGHHERSKATAQESERSERRERKRPRGAERPDPHRGSPRAVEGYGPRERATRAARTKAAAGG